MSSSNTVEGMTRSITLAASEEFPIVKGSLVGAFVKVSLITPPLLVVGRLTDAEDANEGQLCVQQAANPNSPTNITCQQSNTIYNYVMHVEMDIGEY